MKTAVLLSLAVLLVSTRFCSSKRNRWNGGVNVDVFNSQANVNANYRRNHNFNAGYNWRTGGYNLGYTWNFGRRRRSIQANAESGMDFKLENNPSASLVKLTTLVEKFSSEHKDAVPEIASLRVSIPANDLASNVTVAKEIICLVRKLQKIFPKTLGNFIVKMIKFHGPNFNINTLGDFYSVDPLPEKDDESHVMVDKEYCEV